MEFKLGQFVQYNSYYVKSKNSIRIETNKSYENTNTDGLIEWALAIDENENTTELNFEGDGILKPLYELVNKQGTGYIIGIKQLSTSVLLYSDTVTIYTGAERKIICKQNMNIIPCIKVAYVMGKTRYVPVNSVCLEGE